MEGEWQLGQAQGLASSVTVTACLMIAMMYYVGIGYAEPLLYRATLQPIAEISIPLGIPDTQAIKRFITPWPSDFVKLLPDLKHYGISPFRRMHNLYGRVGTTFRHEVLVPAEGA